MSGYDEEIIGKAISSIKKKPQESEYQRNDVKNSIASLGFILSTDLPDFETVP